MSRRLVSSGGPWEASGGYSRAVAVGDSCWVSGTTDAGPDGRSRHPDDVAGQTAAILEIVRAALEEAGFGLEHVVRTRMYVTDIGDAPAILRVHRDVFGSIRPAAAMVQVAALIEPTLRVEIEADARR